MAVAMLTVFVVKESFSWWVPSGWEVVVVLVVLAIWLYSLRRLHTVWERTLNYTQVHSCSGRAGMYQNIFNAGDCATIRGTQI